MPTPAADRPEVDLPEKETYTYEDYRRLPEGAPYELICGHLVMSPASTPYHQLIQANLFFELSKVVRERNQGRVVGPPLDVRLDDTTVLQPDLVYLATARVDRIGEQAIEGAPDLVAEILSPATAHRDLTEKKRLYETHGVREYWVVDPDQQTVEVFGNTEEGFHQRARVVEDGTVTSGVLDSFEITLSTLFQ
ncbi:MAG: Uma2 family endonuclease [Salinibacter sp.]